jgi:hypothetical protein
LNAIQARPKTPASVEPTASPASEALKFIATQDENKRSPPRTNSAQDSIGPTETLSHTLSEEDLLERPSIVSDTKPPLPPRRVQSPT